MLRFSSSLRQFSSSTPIDALFKRSVMAIQLPSDSPIKRKQVDDKEKLSLYALFKQAEEGPVKGDRPGMLDFVNRAKYDAWAKLGSMSQEEAKQKYVEVVSGIFYGSLPEVKEGDIKKEEKVDAPAQQQNGKFRASFFSFREGLPLHSFLFIFDRICRQASCRYPLSS